MLCIISENPYMPNMNSNPPNIIDRLALSAHRARAELSPVTFLRDFVHAELHERLTEVNREFKNVAIVSATPETLGEIFPEATKVTDNDALAFGTKQFDLIIHDLALHWHNDPVGQLVQSRLALKPDGLFVATLFGGQTLYELRASLAEAEIEISGGLSPRIAPMAEIRDLGALLQRAGFALPVADANTLTVSYANQFKLMKDLRGMGEANAMSGRIKHFSNPKLFLESEKRYQENFSDDTNRITATFEIVTLTGWAPDKSQQKALRPGSAKNRLAQALGAVETKLESSED